MLDCAAFRVARASSISSWNLEVSASAGEATEEDVLEPTSSKQKRACQSEGNDVQWKRMKSDFFDED